MYFISYILNSFIIFVLMKKLEKIIVTIQEIRMATRPNVYRNKKKYTRKKKHINEVYNLIYS